MDTISQIKPHRFYPSGNLDDLLFGGIDLCYILTKHDNIYVIRETITLDLQREEGSKRNKIIASNFLLNCIHLLGIFAATASSIEDSSSRSVALGHCCAAFLQGWQSSHEMYSQKIWEDWEDKKNIDITVNIPQ